MEQHASPSPPQITRAGHSAPEQPLWNTSSAAAPAGLSSGRKLAFSVAALAFPASRHTHAACSSPITTPRRSRSRNSLQMTGRMAVPRKIMPTPKAAAPVPTVAPGPLKIPATPAARDASPTQVTRSPRLSQHPQRGITPGGYVRRVLRRNASTLRRSSAVMMKGRDSPEGSRNRPSSTGSCRARVTIASTLSSACSDATISAVWGRPFSACRAEEMNSR